MLANESRITIVIKRQSRSMYSILFLAIVRHARILEVPVLVVPFLEALLALKIGLFALDRFFTLDAGRRVVRAQLVERFGLPGPMLLADGHHFLRLQRRSADITLVIFDIMYAIQASARTDIPLRLPDTIVAVLRRAVDWLNQLMLAATEPVLLVLRAPRGTICASFLVQLRHFGLDSRGHAGFLCMIGGFSTFKEFLIIFCYFFFYV